MSFVELPGAHAHTPTHPHTHRDYHSTHCGLVSVSSLSGMTVAGGPTAVLEENTSSPSSSKRSLTEDLGPAFLGAGDGGVVFLGAGAVFSVDLDQQLSIACA